MFLFRKRNRVGVWIKNRNGFELINDERTRGSINQISESLGYDSSHIHTFHGKFRKNSNIELVAFEVFTTNIAYILVRDYKVKITQRKVNRFLKTFDYHSEYDSLFIRDYLLDGIANKSLPFEFLRRVFKIDGDNPNEEYYIKYLGIKLFFVNGLLASFKLDNDLEEWARHFKHLNKDIIANYAKLTKKYWGDDYDMIFLEVNKQSEAFANTPSGYNNEFVRLHQDEFGTTNFLMLLIVHYGLKINEEQFKHFNHGRYQKLANIGRNIYRLRNFTYSFDKAGKLIKTNNIKKVLD